MDKLKFSFNKNSKVFEYTMPNPKRFPFTVA